MAATTTTAVEYKGRKYRLLWIGQTKFGHRAKLQFFDGTKEFWVDNADPKTAQLLLLLGDQQYAVAPVVGCPVGARQFWLTKLPTSLTRTVYTVTQRASGHCDCSCPDCQYRSRACKHIRALVALGVLDSEPTVEPDPTPPACECAESCCCVDCDPFARVA